jgi:hypothetical protein
MADGFMEGTNFKVSTVCTDGKTLTGVAFFSNVERWLCRRGVYAKDPDIFVKLIHSFCVAAGDLYPKDTVVHLIVRDKKYTSMLKGLEEKKTEEGGLLLSETDFITGTYKMDVNLDYDFLDAMITGEI